MGDADAIARGAQIYRARCVGCHKSAGGSGSNLFRTTMSPSRFRQSVAKGTEGTTMPAFGSLLTTDQIWEVHAFVLSRDRLD